MPSEIETYPKILTDADWQAKKGKIAKLAGKTGIGELMKKCQAAHGRVSWTNKYLSNNRIDWRTIDPSKDKFEVVKELEPTLVKEFMVDAAPVRKLLAELRDQAKKTAADWKKNKLIPSSSTKHAEDVAKEADHLYQMMKENSAAVKSLFGIDELLAALEKKKQESLKVLPIQIDKCEKGLIAVLKTPTKKVWNDGGAHQGCRSVCNGIASIPELKKQYFATWQVYGDNYCDDIPDGDPKEAELVTAKAKKVAVALAQYKLVVAKLRK